MIRSIALKKPLLVAASAILIEAICVNVNVATSQTASPRGMEIIGKNPEHVKNEGALHAVFTGINRYRDPRITSLDYAEADAKAMHDLIRGRTPYNVGEFVLLTNEKATLENILRALRQMETAREEDTVLVYFASHGTIEQDVGRRNDEAHLVPYDGEPGNLRQTGLSLRYLRDLLDKIGAKRIFLLLDTCYSGDSIGRTFSFGPTRRSTPDLNELMRLMTKTKGRALLSASRPEEVSIELHSLGHGVFTYFLMEGMKGAADLDGNMLVTMNELYSYVQKKVSTLTTELGISQHPLMDTSLDGDLVLTLASAPQQEDEKAFRKLIEQAKLLFRASKVVVLGNGQDQVEMHVDGQLFGSWKEQKREVLIPSKLFPKGETIVEIKLTTRNERGAVGERRFKVRQGQDLEVFVEAPKRPSGPVEPILTPMAP